jgi:fructosamine-3-kinase
MWDGIECHISSVMGTDFKVKSFQSVGGGSINQAYCLGDGDRKFFVKTNNAIKVGMFEAEATGLNEMADTHSIRVPRGICWGVAGSASYIVLEWLELSRSQSNWAAMGKKLAQLHQSQSLQGFGWHQNNTIGDTPQMNAWCSDWTEFFIKSRLKYQFQLAQRRGGTFANQDRLLGAIPVILENHQPEPALVHGDLWSGNAAFISTGEPVIFDPAPYYGDREVDLAMTELFGGFPKAFYEAYEGAYPLKSGYEIRKILYNLYHILNHFNLFGGGYHSQADQMIQRLLKNI